MKLDVMKTS